MYLSRIQVINYKSFMDSGSIDLNPGINIITGQNSAGKTALLEAVSLKFNNTPHRSLMTLKSREALADPISRVKFSFEFTKEESIKIFSRISSPYIMPKPEKGDVNEAIQCVHKYLNHELPQRLNLCVTENEYISNLNLTNRDLSFGSYEASAVVSSKTNFLSIEGGFGGSCHDSNADSGLSVAGQYFIAARKNIYRFFAERMNIAVCSRIFESELLPNASNLPEVLGILQGDNSELFNLFNKYVSIVFPQIKRIAIQQLSQVEIRVWYIEPSTQRSDLAFSLSDCGTGVGQVLSILYVVLTAHISKIIIIDEPQSFLHPGAAKKLIEVLKEIGRSGHFPEHQYIVSTHSPNIITAADPSTITMLRYSEDCQTYVESMNAEDNHSFRLLLAEVGVRLSDVFGMDKILWVEGPTEEKCYPMIIDSLLKLSMRGIQILAIKNTGDLEGKKAHLIFDIYDKLSGSQSLFPPAIGFIFDKELRTVQEQSDLKKRSKNPVLFLPRRMYENYLLNSNAITAVLNEELAKAEIDSIDTQIIEQKLNVRKLDKKYLRKVLDVERKNLEDDLDAAKILEDLFEDLSVGRIKFSKTLHSIRLTEWLLENQPSELKEIADLLTDVLREDYA